MPDDCDGRVVGPGTAHALQEVLGLLRGSIRERETVDQLAAERPHRADDDGDENEPRHKSPDGVAYCPAAHGRSLVTLG